MVIIKRQTPSLVKYCEEKYNIMKGCQTIRLGTLHEYRNIENQLLRDEGEGKFHFGFHFKKGVQIPDGWLNFLQSMPGSDTGEFKGGSKIGPEGIFVGEYNVELQSHNQWIYCLSSDTNDTAGSISENYADCWFLKRGALQSFAEYIREEIAKSLTLEDLSEEHYQLRLSELQNIWVGYSCSAIEYTKRSKLVKEFSSFDEEEIKRQVLSIPFKKPQRFSEEKEIRICFTLHLGGQIIGISDKPKIINLRPIDELISLDNRS